jgi:hypothetical protein
MSDVASGSGRFAAAGPERARDPRPVPWSPVFSAGPPTAGDRPAERDRPADGPRAVAPDPRGDVPRVADRTGAAGGPDPLAALGTAHRTGPSGPGDQPDGSDAAATGDPAASSDQRDAGTPTPPRRRRALLAVLAGTVVLGGAAAVVLGVLDVGRGQDAAAPETVVLPSPTPTVAPVARQPVSAFADSLPSSVLTFALTSIAEHPPLLLAGAVEGWRLDYTDGAGGALTVTAGQWETDADAAAALAAATAAAGGASVPVADGEPTTGEVQVGGAVVGTWTLTQAPDGTATVSWSNGTAVLQATGPADVVRDVYAAYPY